MASLQSEVKLTNLGGKLWSCIMPTENRHVGYARQSVPEPHPSALPSIHFGFAQSADRSRKRRTI